MTSTRFFSCLSFLFTLLFSRSERPSVRPRPSRTTRHETEEYGLNSVSQINQLKRTWSQGQGGDSEYCLPPAASYPVDGSSLLFNQVKPVEHMEVLSALPPKAEVDQLVRKFFDRNSFPISVPRKSLIMCRDVRRSSITAILHEPTFMREVCSTAGCILSLRSSFPGS